MNTHNSSGATHAHRNRALISLFFALLALSFSGAAIRYNEFPDGMPDQLSDNRWWFGTLQDEEHLCVVSKDVDLATTNLTSYTHSAGNSSQPLIHDWNRDGAAEILQYSGSTYYLYDHEMNILDSVVLPSVPRAPPQMMVTRLQGRSTFEAYPFYHNGSTVFILDVSNESEISLATSIYLSDNNINLVDNALVCAEDSADSQLVCVAKALHFVDEATAAAGVEANRDDACLLFLHKPVSNTSSSSFTEEVVCNLATTQEFNGTQRQLPTFGVKEFAFGVQRQVFAAYNLNWTCYNDGTPYDSSCAGFSVWHLESAFRGTRALQKKHLFDGSYQENPVDSYYHNPVAFIDIDGGGQGQAEIWFVGRRGQYTYGSYPSKDKTDIHCYKMDGTACTGYPVNLLTACCGFGFVGGALGSNDYFRVSNFNAFDCDGDGYDNPVASFYLNTYAPSSASSIANWGTACFKAGGTYFSKTVGSNPVNVSGDYTRVWRRAAVSGAIDPSSLGFTRETYFSYLIEDLNSDAYADVFTADGVAISPDNSTSPNIISHDNSWGDLVLPADVDGDGFIDIVEYGTSTKTYLSEFPNSEPSISSFSVDDGTVLVDVTVTGTASWSDTESDPVDFAYDCDWTGAPEDAQNCGTATDQVCFDDLVPTTKVFTCSYAVPGTYTVKVYVNDDAHLGENASFQNWDSDTETVIVSAVPPESDVAYGTYQYDSNLSGRVPDNSDFASGVSAPLSASGGMGFEPLIADFDDDGDQDVLVFASDSMRVYDDGMNLLGSVSLGHMPHSQPALSYDLDSDGHPEVQYVTDVAGTTEEVRSYEYNGSFNLAKNFTITVDGGDVTGITCKGAWCYLASNMSGAVQLWQYSLVKTNTSVVSGLSQLADGSSRSSPLVYDVDEDGVDEVILRADADGDGDAGLFGVSAATLQADADFGDEDGLSSGASIGSPVGFDLDRTGDGEVIVLVEDASGNATTLVLNSDGTQKWRRVWNVASDALGAAIVPDLGYTNRGVCGISLRSSAYQDMRCHKSDGTLLVSHAESTTVSSADDMSGLLAADMLNSGIDALVTDYGLFRFDGVEQHDLTIPENSFSLADVDADGYLEMVYSGSTSGIIDSGASNAEPTITLFTGSTSMLVLSTSSYALSFTDGESDGVLSAVDCDWSSGHDLYNCDTTPYADCRSALASPQSYNCTFNVPGTYTVRGYVNDAPHGGSGALLSEWNYATISVTVSDELPGDFTLFLQVDDVSSGANLDGSYHIWDRDTGGTLASIAGNVGSDGEELLNLSTSLVYCINVTVSGYNEFRDCDMNLTPNFDVGFPIHVFSASMRKLPSSTYGQDYLQKWSDEFSYYSKPEHNGWHLDTYAYDSSYSTALYDSLYGRMLNLNTTGVVGSFKHRTYNERDENRFLGMVALKKAVTSEVDSNTLYIIVRDASSNQIAALYGYTEDSGDGEIGYVQYWHPGLNAWVTATNVTPNIPFRFRMDMDKAESSYDLAIDRLSQNTFVAVATVPYITTAVRPYFIELVPGYTGDTDDIYVDTIYSLDYYPEGISDDSYQDPDYEIPESDVCNQFYYDEDLGRWKYDSSRCDARPNGGSVFFNMGKNVARWSLASLTKWILSNFLYFIVFLTLVILLAPIIIRLRRKD